MVRLGEHDLSTTTDSQTFDLPVDLKIIHELFDSKIIYSDIALLRLTQSAPFNDNVRPICLPLTDEQRNRDYTYYQPFLAGWGATTYRGSQATILQEVQLPIQPTKQCEDAYKQYFPDQIFDDKVLCVGVISGGKDSCQGPRERESLTTNDAIINFCFFFLRRLWWSIDVAPNIQRRKLLLF